MMSNSSRIWCAPSVHERRKMRRHTLCIGLALVASTMSAQQPAGIVDRVRQLVGAGNRPVAMAVADSALRASAEGSEAYATALFARAVASSDAVAAERDYARLAVEFPASTYVEEALLLSGEFRMARGERAGARRQFERLILEFPRGTSSAKAGYWAGKMALDDGDVRSGCRSLDFAAARVPAEDVEIRNQVEYLRTRCQQQRAVPSSDSTKRDSAVVASPPVTPPPTRATPAPRADARDYSVQVAAFGRRGDAEALARRLKQRGFPVRVVGSTRPFRVRIGRYDSREAAVAALARIKKSKVNGMVVEAEPK